MKKLFYFICRSCNRRKPQEKESFARPGICQRCYNLDMEIAEREDDGVYADA